MIYIINGAPTAGKDTFCDKVREIMTDKYVFKISTVDLVKDIAINLGWNGEKTPKDRKFLADLKQLLTEWNDIPFKNIVNRVKSIEQEFTMWDQEIDKMAIFIMCREPQEIERLKRELNAKTILVQRTAAEQRTQSNKADGDVLNYNYDIVIDNNGSFLDLTYKAFEFVEEEELYFPHWKSFSIGLDGKIIEK